MELNKPLRQKLWEEFQFEHTPYLGGLGVTEGNGFSAK